MKIALQFLSAIGLAINAAAAGAACSPVPGADQIWSKAGVHWVFIGELHGSNETPAAFHNLVCDAIAQGKHVTVALERPTSEQAALDNMLTAKDLAAARESLLQLPGWKDVLDGRASEAMLRLLVSLRELRKLHPDLKVVAFDAPYAGPPAAGPRDEAMGHALLSLRPAKPNGVVLILTGNLHAMQASKRGYDLAAMYLPAKEILSLEVTDRGGETWSETTEDGCGPLQGGVPDKDASRPYGIFLDPSLAPFGKVDGVLSLGAPMTPSAPAAGVPTPVPACRTKFLAEHQTVSKKQ
ncbi:MAG TPA: hypothetical protein VLA83_11195 [Candidatus Binatia bacterium]|nr:hypothetical protein [Candidatus Binatia bacterium]